MNYTSKQIEDLINDIYSGKVTQTELPEDLYLAIGDHLKEALYKGFGGDLKDFNIGSKDYELLNEFRENVYMFSGAKTYQQVREMTDFVADSKTFSDFKEKAMGVYDTYNKDWLKAEYNTAVGQAQTGRLWNEIEKNKEDFPYLMYSAVIDAHTSDICEPCNGVTLPVDDPFWSEYMPLNHFNCRCTVEQIDKYTDTKITPQNEIDAIVEGKEGENGLKDRVDDVFKMNSGKDGYVFSDEHPYFQVEPKDRELAQRNFDLPIPEAPAAKEIDFTPAKSIKEAKEQIANLINRTSGYKVEKMAISSEIGLEQVNERYKTLKSLFEEYKVSEVPNREKDISVNFRSGKSYFGKVGFQYKRDLSEFWVKDMNFGHKSDLSNSRIYDPNFKGGQRFKSRVDEKNINIATVVHEFGHVIAMSEETMIANCPQYLKDFYKELRELNSEYSKELLQFNRARDLAAINEISLGKYALKNVDEFLAEGFTEYKLSSNPSKYAKKIGKLIDKNFKK